MKCKKEKENIVSFGQSYYCTTRDAYIVTLQDGFYLEEAT